jgi:hypothetical protein
MSLLAAEIRYSYLFWPRIICRLLNEVHMTLSIRQQQIRFILKLSLNRCELDSLTILQHRP